MPATDDYVHLQTALDSPYRHAAAVTPSDTLDLTNVTRGIFVGGLGSIALVTEGGETATLVSPTMGAVLRISASRIKATGTTASNLVALW